MTICETGGTLRLEDITGDTPPKSWFQRLLEMTRNKISFEENLDGIFLTVNVGTSETEIGHSLGRAPKYILEVASYPNGIAGIQWTRAPAVDKVWLTRTSAGQCTLFMM